MLVLPFIHYFLAVGFLSVVYIDQCGVLGSSSSGGVALELRYRFEEEQPPGTTVGHVVRDANLARLYDPQVLRQLNFRFLKQQQSSEFTIDSSTGVIKSARRIDRETLCPSSSVATSGLSSSESQVTTANAGGCDIRLDVAVQPLPYFRIIRVSVSIVDINDNEPRFAADKLSIEVPESTAVGSTILTPEASDIDGPEFGVKNYRLDTESDRFKLTPTSSSGVASGPEFRLILTKPLDREQIDQYNLRIVAVDGGFPPKSGYVDVSISVADVNDNSPIFDQEAYEASIPENVAIGTTFLRVSAVDYDVGLNGEVMYSLSSHSAAAHGHLFSVEASSGEVSVRGSIDYEEGPVHRLTVIARDRGGVIGSESSGSASVAVVVHVIDLNDNSPTISVDTLSSTPGAAEIAENSPIGSFVAHLSVADRDSGNNGRFACSPDNPGGGHDDGSSFFRLTPMFGSSEEFQIVTATAFDREQRDLYEVLVTCRDFGVEPLTSSVRVIVHVTDQNDNNPVFDRTSYIGELIENNYVGALLLQVDIHFLICLSITYSYQIYLNYVKLFNICLTIFYAASIQNSGFKLSIPS